MAKGEFEGLDQRSSHCDPERFIEPDLVQVEGRVDDCQVVLIKAPAAVGKTTLARNIARMSRNPYWDLALLKLGSGFFSGTISSAYGVKEYADLVSSLQSGDLCLVLDSLDEAIVASTTPGYEAALENLADIVAASSGKKASAVILGRPETIEETYLRLHELGVQCAIVEVSFFSNSRAKQFVLKKLDAADAVILPNFHSFIESFFERVSAAFGSQDWTVLAPFLGYAPVLDSLEIFYRRSENPFRELQAFANDGDQTWVLISSMLQRVLEREAEKFGGSFGGGDSRKREFGRSAYNPEFQAKLLLSDDLENLQSNPEIDDEVDPEWLVDLDAKIKDQFVEHPFLTGERQAHRRNILLGFMSTAFRDYVIAQEIVTAQADDLETLRSYWVQAEVVPSMMLSKFVKSLALGGERELSAVAFQFVVDSHGRQPAESAELAYIEWEPADDDQDSSTSSRCVLTWQPGSDSVASITASLGDELSLPLARSCAYVAISLPGAIVHAGAGIPEFEFGPRCVVECDAIRFDSNEVRIVGSTGSLAVTPTDRKSLIRSRSVEGFVRRVNGSPANLTIGGAVLVHPWQRFGRELSVVSGGSEVDLLLPGIFLRRIVTWFSRGGMRFDVEKMQTILSKGRASSPVFEFLMRNDYIWVDGSFYRMRLDVGLEDVKSMNLESPKYRTLVSSIYDHVVLTN